MKSHITFIILCSYVSDVFCAVTTELDGDKYLHKYGYLRGTFDPDSGRQASQQERTYALKYFQHFSNIPITGVFDTATMDKMNQKRCACEDVMTKDTLMNASLSFTPQQFNLGPKWSNTSLTWRFNKYSLSLRDNNVIRSELTRAFRVWSDVTPLRFTEVTDPYKKVNIDMSFELDEHGDGRYNAFDKKGGVLAHAFFPENGNTHFDDREEWVIQSDRGTDFFTVAAHEIGHALGLAHSKVNGALMAPYYAGYNPNFRLHYDDIRGIQTLYGGPTTNPYTPRPVPLTTMRPPVRTPRPTLRPTPRPTLRPTPRRTPRPTGTPRPPITEGPVVTPSPREECNMIVEASVRDFDGTLLLFTNGTTMYEVDLRRRNRPVQTTQTRKFSSAKSNPDAVYNLLNMGMTFIMKGQMIWQYDRMGNEMKQIFVQGGGYALPERPRAVIAPTDNDIWIIGSSIVCRMSPRGEVVRGSHAYFSSTFPRVPYPVDSAVSFDTDTVLFFKDQKFYQYSMGSRRVTRSDCSVKSAFGLYIIALCSQIMLLTLDCVTIMIAAQTQGACTFESYHLKVNLHFASALAVFIGIIVESSGGIKGWQFYICLIAGFLAAFNAIMWFITQRRVRRSKVKAAIRNAEETLGGGSEAAGASAETLSAEAVDKAQETVDKVKGKAVEKAKEKAVKQAKKKAVKAALKKL